MAGSISLFDAKAWLIQYRDMNINKNTLILISLTLLALIFSAASLNSNFQSKAKDFFYNKKRQVLAKIIFKTASGAEFLILKVIDNSSLNIEIFLLADESRVQKFKQKFELLYDRDAFINLNKNSTNLALSDVNQDGTDDILAPSVDQNGNLRLNAFSYNADLDFFESLSNSSP